MGIRQSEQRVESDFSVDRAGNPTGGHTRMSVDAGEMMSKDAIVIDWQDGPVEDGEQNGAFVEDVIEAARQRIQFFNSNPKFRCRENSLAITKLEEALQWLDWRTRQRLIQNVENTYEAHTSD